MTTLVTGGAGYIGIPLSEELLDSGRTVRVLDSLVHGQEDLVADLSARGAEVLVGDVRDPAARAAALSGVDEVVHLAAIVGDPACAADPDGSREINVEATLALVHDAQAAGVGRLVFASTCSNYGRMADPSVPITEEGELAPVSRYAEQKVAVEEHLLHSDLGSLGATCVRFATVYGVAPRMRFDLTVNEFTRDLWAGRRLDVFGEQFWRPYVHVRDAARGVRLVLDRSSREVAGQVFNVGHSDENYRKLDIVEAIRKTVTDGEVAYVERTEDPRDYKVSFERIHRELGYVPVMTVPDGVTELVAALDDGRFPDPWARRYRNT
ncbi:NAD-dependent epimerase/dehydratase family protein [Actinomycetospora sp. CA-084318]|uniref:NAD-dependent epimerase/dehydratase family protein n=1 Tax=Actinomycetospora sp. CA-084318 TaxID=3239892 RepID=UPI003D9611E8